VQKVEAQDERRVQEASVERERLRYSLEDMKQALVQQESKIDPHRTRSYPRRATDSSG
jgi:hypothetical protein